MTVNIENLTLSRGGKAILSGLNLSVCAGGCVMLRGDNGSGKTTLLKTLAGLLPVWDGTVQIDTGDTAYSGHLDGIKLQLSVAENLAFWAGIYHAANLETVRETLNLTDLNHRIAGTLSAGQKRRLGLARLLLSGAKIWLMDEPTTSLDQHTTRAVAQLIADHCAAGGIAVISTHVDLNIPNAQTLNLSDFTQAQTTTTDDPFLAGDFT